MALKEKSKPERVSELVDMARRRTRQARPQWVSGLQLVGMGVMLTLFGGLLYVVINAGPGPNGSPSQGFIALGSFVASITGGIMILAGIIRWGVQPVIYYQEKLLERTEHNDRTPKPPVDEPTA
jgi:predicted nucleic acid-binding Zn ribbon protein